MRMRGFPGVPGEYVYAALFGIFAVLVVYGVMRDRREKKAWQGMLDAHGKAAKAEGFAPGGARDLSCNTWTTRITDNGRSLLVEPLAGIGATLPLFAVFFILVMAIMIWSEAPAAMTLIFGALIVFTGAVVWLQSENLHLDFEGEKYTLISSRGGGKMRSGPFGDFERLEYYDTRYSEGPVMWLLRIRMKKGKLLSIGSYDQEEQCLLAAKELSARMAMEYVKTDPNR